MRAWGSEEISTTRRALLLRWVAVGLSLLLIARLLQLQILQHDEWDREAKLTRMTKVILPAKRGTMIDRAGCVVARDKTFYDLRFDLARLVEYCEPVALAELLTHLERLRGARAGIVGVSEVLANPEWAAGRLLSTEGRLLRGARDPLVRREILLFGRMLLRGMGPGESKIDPGLLSEVLKGKHQGALGDLLPVDRTRLVGRLDSWRERLWKLESMVLEPLDGFALFADEYREKFDREYRNRPSSGALEDELDYGARVEFWRKKRGRALRWVKDVPYDPTIAFLDLNWEDYPGIEPALRMRREYSNDLALHAIGRVRLPTEDQTEEYKQALGRLGELRWQFDRSDAQQDELERLMHAISVDMTWLTDMVGWDGLEGRYDDVLKGTRGYRSTEWDRRVGAPRDEEEVFDLAPVPGAELGLTLDMELQGLAEKLLTRADLCTAPPGKMDEDYIEHPRGAFVLMDARDGSLIVLATCPSYKREDRGDWDLWKTLKDSPWHPLHHRAYQPFVVPQPGSVFKPFVALALLRDLRIDPDALVHCGGSYRSMSCNSDFHGDLALSDAIARSCNVYFYKGGELLGMEGLLRVAHEFGFDEKTGIDSTGEVSGWFRQHEHLHSMTTRAFAIGQNVPHTTPLQIARAYAALATGYLPRPRIVRSIDGRLLAPGPRQRIAFSASDLDLVREGMIQTIQNPRGTGRALKDVPIALAGKTGTAEVGRGTPDHAWFAGFFPFDRPRFAVAIFCENAGVHGGDLAAPILREFLLSEEWKRFAGREHLDWSGER